jgi:hypothetical protein
MWCAMSTMVMDHVPKPPVIMANVHISLLSIINNIGNRIAANIITIIATATSSPFSPINMTHTENQSIAQPNQQWSN